MVSQLHVFKFTDKKLSGQKVLLQTDSSPRKSFKAMFTQYDSIERNLKGKQELAPKATFLV